MIEPLVSIITPAYNSGQYINQCIDSVLAQTYKNWELIVVCAPSQDDTLWRLTQYENDLQDPRIRIVVEDKKTNVAIARNTGLEYAKGTYVTFLDADDWWDDWRLQICANTLTLCPNLAWVSNRQIEHYPDRVNYDDTYPGHSLSVGGTGTCMFTMTLIQEVKRRRGFVFNPKMKSNDDADLILFVRKYPSKLIKRYLTHYRQNAEGLTAKTNHRKRLSIIIDMGLRNHAYGLVTFWTLEYVLSSITRFFTGYGVVGLKKRLTGEIK